MWAFSTLMLIFNPFLGKVYSLSGLQRRPASRSAKIGTCTFLLPSWFMPKNPTVSQLPHSHLRWNVLPKDLTVPSHYTHVASV